MTTSTTKSTRQNADRVLIGGISKHLSNIASVMVDGVSYTPSQISALLQQEIDATDAVDPARAAWLAAVTAQRALTNKLKAIKSALRSFVVNLFGKGSSVLADFGYTKQAPRPAPATQVAATEKRLATRAARHTQGKQQKKRIKGTVPASAPSAVSGNGNAPKA